MKKINIKSLFTIIIAVLIIFTTSSFAIYNVSANEVGVSITKNLTAEFKEWQNLSDEEKENTIQPQAYNLNVGESTKKSVISGATSAVGDSVLPSEFIIVDEDKIPDLVKNQQTTEECWAFSTTSILETNVKKTRNKNMLFSPRHIDYATSRVFADGINLKGYNRNVGSGNFYISLAYCVSGNGPVLYEQMPFENNTNKINLSEIDIDPALKLENYVQFADIYKDYSTGSIKYYDTDISNSNVNNASEYSKSDVNKVRDLIKNHLMNYGALSGYMYIGQDMFNYVNSTEEYTAYFNNNSNKSFNHAVTIIGWDDNFSKDNFREDKKPENDGAYIVLNTSYGDYDEFSVLYVSYDDLWIETNNFGIVSTTDIDYENIYQYDEYGYNMPVNLTDENGNNISSGYIANVFDAKEKDGKDEYINEVSIYLPTTSNVDIYLNPEGDDKTAITKYADADVLTAGYHTIKLSTPVKITGDKFVVAAKLTTDEVLFGTECNFQSNGLGSSFFDYVTANAGESFYARDISKWKDLNDKIEDTNICLKAFTTYQDEPEEIIEPINVEKIELDKTKIELKEGESATLVVSITPSNADNKNITWTTDNASIATVTSTGIIKAVKEGTTTITATSVDGGKIATCIVTVKGEIPEEDEIYYNNDDDSSSNNGSSTNTSTNTINDTTRATGTIPQTGTQILKIASIVIIVILASVIIFIKYKRNNDVK